jgi:thiamine-phosphate pyrophosphorylase
MDNKLQYISQGSTRVDQLHNIQTALDAGCDWIQLRFKNADEKEFSATAEDVKKICITYKARFIINDHVALTKLIDADGVHLGLNDMPVTEARIILGDTKIIGGTANTLEDVMQRVKEKCDYIGLGPFRFTSTKEKLSPVLGIEGYKKIMTFLVSQNISIPVFAIGGIEALDIQSIINTGVHGIAVSAVITNHPDKKELIEQLNTFLYATT